MIKCTSNHECDYNNYRHISWPCTRFRYFVSIVTEWRAMYNLLNTEIIHYIEIVHRVTSVFTSLSFFQETN